VQGVPTGTDSPPESLEPPEEPPELVEPPAPPDATEPPPLPPLAVPPLVAFITPLEHACAVRAAPPITMTWNILFMSKGLP
jgi:hypothetical protein